MTGFGFAETMTADYAIAIEIKSYNNRYLEIDVNLPPSFSRIEKHFRDFFNGKAARGKIELYLKLKEFNESIDVAVNKEGVRAQMKALQEIVDVAGINEQIHLAHLLRLEGVIKSFSPNNADKYWPIVKPLLEDAYTQFDRSRQNEGTNIKTTIQGLVCDFESELDRIIRQEPLYKEKLSKFVRDRFQEALGDQIDESRVLTEIASLLLKGDIHEEIVRLQSHLSSYREILKLESVIGKKLDFLCQELNREINTIGSKSLVYEINNAVIACKEIIERMRELLRNVE